MTPKVPPPLERGPRWLRESYNELRAYIISGTPLPGINTMINQSPDGTAIHSLLRADGGYLFGTIAIEFGEVLYDFYVPFGITATKLVTQIAGGYADLSVAVFNADGEGLGNLRYTNGPYSRTDLSPDTIIPLYDGIKATHNCRPFAIPAGGGFQLGPFDVDPEPLNGTLDWELHFTGGSGAYELPDPGPI